MKLKVEKQFRDKITGKLHEINSVFEVDDERGRELLGDDRNLVTQIKETAAKPKAKAKATTKAKGKKAEE